MKTKMQSWKRHNQNVAVIRDKVEWCNRSSTHEHTHTHIHTHTHNKSPTPTPPRARTNPTCTHKPSSLTPPTHTHAHTLSHTRTDGTVTLAITKRSSFMHCNQAWQVSKPSMTDKHKKALTHDNQPNEKNRQYMEIILIINTDIVLTMIIKLGQCSQVKQYELWIIHFSIFRLTIS